MVGDSCAVIEEHRVRENDDGAGPLRGDRREGVVDPAGVPRLQGLKPYPQCPGRILRVSHLRCVVRIGRISEESHPRDLGKDLLEQLQLLPDQLGQHVGDPGDVSARAREAGDESRRHRIRDRRHDDGYRLGRLLRRLDRVRTCGHDDVHLETDQLGARPGSRSYSPPPIGTRWRCSGLPHSPVHVALAGRPAGSAVLVGRRGRPGEKAYAGRGPPAAPRWPSATASPEQREAR